MKLVIDLKADLKPEIVIGEDKKKLEHEIIIT